MANNSSQHDQSHHSPNRGKSARHDEAAVELIRDKVDKLYSEEPDVQIELAKSENTPARSKHQDYIHTLLNSDKGLATIQTEWHEYYQQLPDDEKRQVWQEFYDSQPSIAQHVKPSSVPAKEPQRVAAKRRAERKIRHSGSSVDNIKQSIKDTVTGGGKLGVKHQLQSLLFGLSVGIVVVIIFMFGFFNEVFIAPFIQPSRAQADTPLIIGNSTIAPTPTPEVIIPKINVEIPVNYSVTSTNESVIENDLEGGVVHYPSTVLPGQDGNAAFFGHSSNNIFNPGKYKFAFVLLHTLVDGDTFYLTYNDKVYVYKVISHTIVSPSDVSVLGPVPGQTATATLITCDPPGTSINRLIVVGKQISPNPAGNTAAAPTVTPVSTPPSQLPGNGPTLWTRFLSTLWGKLLASAVVIAAAIWLLRAFNRYARRNLKPDHS